MSKSEARSAIGSEIGDRVKLADFRSTVTPLTIEEREILIDRALDVLERTYAHLPLKRALHVNDPIQSLKLLRLRHSALDERAFQSAMMDVFLGLRDLHTNYVLPNGYRDKFAFLPFRVEEFYEPGGVVQSGVTQSRKYVVSWVSPVNTVTSLKEGVVVTHWNGSPIDIAVARNGNREAGSNLDARRAQGIESLTLRWLGMSLPPDEDWVDLTYTDGINTIESRFEWEIIDSGDRRTLLAGLTRAAGVARGLDLNRVLLDRIRRRVFDPQAIRLQKKVAAQFKKGNRAPFRGDSSALPDVFPRFGAVTTPSGKFAYVRLKSFAPQTTGNVIVKAVEEFGRILRTLPPTGLILDVRGNGGGYINIGELILQMLTPRKIIPEGFQLLATPTTLSMARIEVNQLKEWEQTILEGLESGASFSQGFPLTSPEGCNSIGQIYQGPVVLITDALCYSTTDIFSAGFQDHQIGTVLGCHSSTGAGGANVVDYEDLQSAAMLPSNPFTSLPRGASMRVAFRRCTRVGMRSGTPVEDYGVVPDLQYFMTKADVVGDNPDLIAAAAKILKDAPKQTLRLAPDAAAPRQKFKVDFTNIDRFDILVNDRPMISQDATASPVQVALPKSLPAGRVVTANGYRKNELVVSTRIRV